MQTGSEPESITQFLYLFLTTLHSHIFFFKHHLNMIIICSSNILIINMIYYYDLEQNNIYIYILSCFHLFSCDTSLYF